MDAKAKHAEYMRGWVARNRERVNAWRRANRAANKDHINETKKAWEQVRSEASKEKEAARRRVWAAAHRERINALNGAYRRRTGRYWIHIWQKFGVSREGWTELFDAQGRKCAVCSAEEPGTKRFWQIDHCHATGAIRGILCAHCNAMLGRAKDDPDILTAGARYILAHRQLSDSPIS